MLPVDWCTVLYVAVSVTILLARFGLLRLPLWTVALPVAAALAFLAPRFRERGSGGRFFGEFYPVFLTIALYTEIGVSNRAWGVSHDALVQSWERAIFRGSPSLEWMNAWPDPVISSILHLGYFSYYLIVLGAPLALWLSGRREAARRSILLMMIAFYVSYSIFRLFPVAGPRFVFPLPDSAALHTPVAAFVHSLVARGSAWGTAFPSSHVAVAFVNAGAAWRGWQLLGAVAWSLSVVLAFGTVYGQFHYAIDAVAGALLGALILLLARWI